MGEISGNASDDIWIPANNVDQACAICGTQPVSWVHPLLPDRVQFRLYGKGHTLPTYWAFCDRCEALNDRLADDELLELMMRNHAWVPEAPQQPPGANVEPRLVLGVFRFASLAKRALPAAER